MWTRRINTSNSALSQIETPFVLIASRVSGFMTAPAAGRQDLRAAIEQAGNHTGLAAAEIGLAMAGENVGNAHAGRLLDLGIGIDEWDGKPGGEPAADRRFADPHHTDQHDRTALQRGADRRRRPSRIGVIL